MQTARKRMMNPANSNQIAVAYREMEKGLVTRRKWVRWLVTLMLVSAACVFVVPYLPYGPIGFIAGGLCVLGLLPGIIISFMSHNALSRSQALVQAYKAQPNWRDI